MSLEISAHLPGVPPQLVGTVTLSQMKIHAIINRHEMKMRSTIDAEGAEPHANVDVNAIDAKP